MQILFSPSYIKGLPAYNGKTPIAKPLAMILPLRGMGFGQLSTTKGAFSLTFLGKII